MTPRAQWIFAVLILSVGSAIALFAVLSIFTAPERLSANEIVALAESGVPQIVAPARPAGATVAETKLEALVAKVPEFKGADIAFREETIPAPRTVERFVEPASPEAKAWEAEVEKLAEQRRVAVQARVDAITEQETEKLRDIMSNIMQVLAGLVGAAIGARRLLRKDGTAGDPAATGGGAGR